MRARARLAAYEGDVEAAERWFRRSIELFRELATPFFQARAQIQCAELIAAPMTRRRARGGRARYSQTLGATPWLERARALTSEVRCVTRDAPPAAPRLTPGQRFCGQCGAPLARGCARRAARRTRRIIASADPCGSALSAGVGGAGAPTQAASAAVAERRLVSVLFADLVGFTTLSEHRDPEEVRELLSRYFDRCRVLIERFGGTVEKFIGDAVMAVWGTPVAREDDAERAVRTGLALTQAVALLGEEVGMPELRARAGVLTGSAAVELGAEGEGMVLGDTVNTASRLQSIAEPGTVLVDDVTRRASEAAIAYEDAGVHQVKGREQPVHAWAALRVVAGAGGARRTAGLEAPFVGRDRELRDDHRGGRRERRRRAGAARVGPRRSRLGQVAAAVGVLQVPRRGRGGSLLASGPVPLLRRGRRLLGAGGDGPRSRRDPGRGRAADRRARSYAPPSSSSCPTSASAGWSSRASRTCCASRSARTPTAPICSRAGGCSSSGCPTTSR